MFSHAVKNFVGKLFPVILLLVAFAPSFGQGMTVIAHPFDEDLVFSQPINRWSYWFDNIPGYEFQQPSRIVLTYTESATLKSNMGGSLTVMLNDKPIASRPIPNAAGQTSEWTVNLPTNYFRSGINELRIVSRHRSVEGICSDYDNSTNWVKLKTTTYLELTRKSHTPYPLAVYPFPYLDVIADKPVACDWILPSSPSADDIAAMLTMATDWGFNHSSRLLRFSVKRGGSQSDKHAILFGQGSSSGASGSISTEMENGKSRLYIGGGDAASMFKSINALAHADLTSGLQTTRATITQSPDEDEVKPGSRYGVFTFKDLGLRSIRIVGAFHQYAVFTVPRPLLANLGDKCYLNLNFKHSASLSPLRSVLSVAINGREIGSIRLKDANANNGKLRLLIPAELLRDSVWNISLSCFHDLPSAYCDKFYDAIAWTLVDESSTITLVDGSYAGTPYLERFPYLRNDAGKIALPVTFWLPANPTSEQLTTAAIIAARAGQVNQQRISWQVQLGEMQGRPKGCVIVIADRSSMGHLSPLRDQLKVSPNDSGNFTINPDVNVLNETLQSFVLTQASRSPWRSDAVVYTVIADKSSMLSKFDAVLTDSRKMNDFKGDVCLLDRTSTLVSYSKSEKELNTRAARKFVLFRGLKGGGMDFQTILLWLLAIIGVLALLGMLRRRIFSPVQSGSGPGGGGTHVQKSVAESDEVLKEMMDPNAKKMKSTAPSIVHEASHQNSSHHHASAMPQGDVPDPADVAPLFLTSLTLEDVLKDVADEDKYIADKIIDDTAPLPVAVEVKPKVEIPLSTATPIVAAKKHVSKSSLTPVADNSSVDEWGPAVFSSSPLDSQAVLIIDDHDEWLEPLLESDVVLSNGQLAGISHGLSATTPSNTFTTTREAGRQEKDHSLFAEAGPDQQGDVKTRSVNIDPARTKDSVSLPAIQPGTSISMAKKHRQPVKEYGEVELYIPSGSSQVFVQLANMNRMESVVFPNQLPKLLIVDDYSNSSAVVRAITPLPELSVTENVIPRKNRRVIFAQDYLLQQQLSDGMPVNTNVSITSPVRNIIPGSLHTQQAGDTFNMWYC